MPIAGPPLNKPFQLDQILKRGLEVKPHELALVSPQTRWTWRELDQASDQMTFNLLRLGLTAGDRVASLMPNRAALLVYYLACIKAGLVATPLNYRYTAPEIDHALEVSKPEVLFVHAERTADLVASKYAGDLPHGLISYGGTLGQNPNFEDLISGSKKASSLPPPEYLVKLKLFIKWRPSYQHRLSILQRSREGFPCQNTFSLMRWDGEILIMLGKLLFRKQGGSFFT